MNRRWTALLLCCLLVLPSARPATADATDKVLLLTPSGPIRGALEGGLCVFKGIPYAAVPERFAPPEAVEPWTEMLDCLAFGPIAPQASEISGSLSVPMDEAGCLTANVWAPAQPPDEKLPVYVWIHGGGFALGASAEPQYDGSNYAREGIVYVSINYRMNALGYLATRETYERYGTTGNWGLLDQIQALKWVQANISAFGGDPGRVTVGGESAGSYSISGLILSPLAKALFQGAILESGSVLGIPGNSQYARGNLERSIELGRQMAYSFGAADDAEGLQKLRDADVDMLVQMAPLGLDFTSLPAYLWLPVFDGYALPEDPIKALKDGDFNRVNLLWGYNRDEGSIFIPESTNQAKYELLATKMFGYDASREILQKFPPDAEHTPLMRARKLLMWGMFSSVMKPFGDAMAGTGMNVYAYHFGYEPPEVAAANIGAHHGAEIAFAFGHRAQGGSAAEVALSQRMFDNWVRFVKTGTAAEDWPHYDPDTALMMAFAEQSGATEMPDRAENEYMCGLMFGEGSTFIN